MTSSGVLVPGPTGRLDTDRQRDTDRRSGVTSRSGSDAAACRVIGLRRILHHLGLLFGLSQTVSSPFRKGQNTIRQTRSQASIGPGASLTDCLCPQVGDAIPEEVQIDLRSTA